MYQSINQWF